jgi:hypothetical protein
MSETELFIIFMSANQQNKNIMLSEQIFIKKKTSTWKSEDLDFTHNIALLSSTRQQTHVVQRKWTQSAIQQEALASKLEKRNVPELMLQQFNDSTLYCIYYKKGKTDLLRNNFQ